MGFGLFVNILCSRGKNAASVFPVPVGAMINRFSPLRIFLTALD